MTAHFHGDGSNAWSPPPSSRFAEAAGESGTGGRRKLNIGSLPPSVFLCPPERARPGCEWQLYVVGSGTRAGMVPRVSCVLPISLTSSTAAYVDFSVVSFRFLPSIPLSLFSQTSPSDAGCWERIPQSCQAVAVGFTSASSAPVLGSTPLHILSILRYLPLTVNYVSTGCFVPLPMTVTVDGEK